MQVRWIIPAVCLLVSASQALPTQLQPGWSVGHRVPETYSVKTVTDKTVLKNQNQRQPNFGSSSSHGGLGQGWQPEYQHPSRQGYLPTTDHHDANHAAPISTLKAPTSGQTGSQSLGIKKYEEGCPAGFVRFSIFPDFCYKIILEGYTWWEAYTNCKRYGADLLYIESVFEQNLLESYIKSEGIDWAGDRLGHIWIGLVKEGRGEWEWANNPGVKPAYTNWFTGSAPANFYASCGHMNPESFLWLDYYCHSQRSGNGNGGSGSGSEAVFMWASMCKAPHTEPSLNMDRQ